MSTQPGADERRIAQLLRRNGVGPDAAPRPAIPPPPARPRDWLDDILNDPPPPPAPAQAPQKPAAAPAPNPQPKAPKRPKRKPGKAKKGKAPAPRQSLLDAHANIPPRLRWLTYHATATGAGWWLGWVDWSTSTAAWYAAGHWTSTSAWVLYGLGGVLLALYRRSRAWAWPFAWAAAIPVSSIVVGVLLYAPNS